MHGWGRVPFLIGLGLAVAVGCGGRTDTLEADNSTGDVGNTAGGASSRAGTGSGGTKTGHGGVSSGGTGPIGVAGTAVGGSYPIPTGGYGFGGYGFGGSGFAGGVTGGAAFGGSFGVAGFPSGGFGGAPADCQSCLLDSCGGELLQCVQDAGCRAIFACMQVTGCQGLACYSPKYCKSVIDSSGGLGGPSMSELLKTFTCAVQAGCQCG